MNQDQARQIVYAHEIDELMDSDEERSLLELNNPGIVEAYKHLLFEAGLSTELIPFPEYPLTRQLFRWRDSTYVYHGFDQRWLHNV